MLEDLLTLSGFLLAVIALVVSLYTLSTAERGARNDLLGQVRGWADDVIEMLAEARALCALDPGRMADGEFFLRRSALMVRASALWDRGRLFFPNLHVDDLGTDKAHAYRGFRPQVLDLLALAYGILCNVDYTGRARNDRYAYALIRLKREFVSVMQQATSFEAPSRLKQYEEHFRRIPVSPLPGEIRRLAGAQRQGFELRFDERLRLEQTEGAPNPEALDHA